jgi:hypothetical protein
MILKLKMLVFVLILGMFLVNVSAIDATKGHLILKSKTSSFNLHYQTEIVNGEEIVTKWSPDGAKFLSLLQRIVPDDYPTVGLRGSFPSKANLEIIHLLHVNNGSILVLRSAAENLDRTLIGDYVGPSKLDVNVIKIFDDSEIITFRNYGDQIRQASVNSTLVIMQETYDGTGVLVVLYVEESLNGKNPDDFAREKFRELGLHEEKGKPIANALIFFAVDEKEIRVVYNDDCGLDDEVVEKLTNEIDVKLNSIENTDELMNSLIKVFDNEVNSNVNKVFFDATVALQREILRRVRENFVCEIKDVEIRTFGEKLIDALDEAVDKEGGYSENKEFIDKLFADGLIIKDEYEEINGKGLFNLEEDMDYVRKILKEVYDNDLIEGFCGCQNIKIVTHNEPDGGEPIQDTFAHLELTGTLWTLYLNLEENRRALGHRSGEVFYFGREPPKETLEGFPYVYDYMIGHSFEAHVNYIEGSNPEKCVNGQIAKGKRNTLYDYDKDGKIDKGTSIVSIYSPDKSKGKFRNVLEVYDNFLIFSEFEGRKPEWISDGYSKIGSDTSFRDRQDMGYLLNSQEDSPNGPYLHWIDTPASTFSVEQVKSVNANDDFKIRVLPDSKLRPRRRFVEQDSRLLFKDPFPADSDVWSESGDVEFNPYNSCHCEFNVRHVWTPGTRFSELVFDKDNSVNCDIIDSGEWGDGSKTLDGFRDYLDIEKYRELLFGD